MSVPTHDSQQPNSNNNRSSQQRNNEKLPPPQRSRAREDLSESGAKNCALLAVNLYRFSARLADAAAWRRGELPAGGLPFSACLWLLTILAVGAATAQ